MACNTVSDAQAIINVPIAAIVFNIIIIIIILVLLFRGKFKYALLLLFILIFLLPIIYGAILAYVTTQFTTDLASCSI